MKVPIFKQRLVQTLWQNVDSNFELYTAEDFNSLFKRPEFSVNIREMETLKLREEDLVNLVPEPKNDGRNAFVIYKALEGMTPNKAQDERIWTALTHTVGFQFSKKRWLSENFNKEKNIKRIKSHFFGRVDGNRGLHRNNALASLWWWAHIVKRGSTEEDFEKRLVIFLNETDVRAQIFERPSSSRVPQVADALIDCVVDKMTSEPNSRFFKSPRSRGSESGPYRRWLKKVDLAGGRQLYNAFTREELRHKFNEFIDEIEQGKG